VDDKRYLLSLIREGEHQQQDFKYRVSDACKLAKSVSAFANTDGGRPLIGLRDDGILSGVRSEEEIFMMHQDASFQGNISSGSSYPFWYNSVGICQSTVPFLARISVFSVLDCYFSLTMVKKMLIKFATFQKTCNFVFEI